MLGVRIDAVTASDLLLPLEAIVPTALAGKLFRNFQEGASGVRER